MSDNGQVAGETMKFSRTVDKKGKPAIQIGDGEGVLTIDAAEAMLGGFVSGYDYDNAAALLNALELPVGKTVSVKIPKNPRGNDCN